LNREEAAIPLLERVVESSVEMPDWLMQKYPLAGHAEVGITPGLVAELPNSNLTAALMLVEIYQERGELQKAVELLEVPRVWCRIRSLRSPSPTRTCT